MASACGGHSSPPPWWRFLGVSSSFCYGGPSNICGLFAVTATLKTRYVCWPINSLSFWICSYIITDAHAIHILVYFYGTDLTSCSIMAFITQAAFPLAESDGFLFYVHLLHTPECCADWSAFRMNSAWLLLSFGCLLPPTPEWRGWCCMTAMGGMRGEQFLHFI